MFTPLSVFDNGEVVLIPRSSGGLSYGTVDKQFISPHCYLDTTVAHNTTMCYVSLIAL